MTGVFLALFFTSSDQDFVLHLDTSESKEEESGSDDEAGVAGTPGKFTLIVFSVNQGCSVYYYHTYIIGISKLNFCCFCSVQFPLVQFLVLVLALVKQPPLLLHASIYFFHF